MSATTSCRQLFVRFYRRGQRRGLSAAQFARPRPDFARPTSEVECCGQVASYVYHVSLKMTGPVRSIPIAAVIRRHVSIPVGVGFGIRDAATAQAIGRVADAVVIGSRIIQLIEDQPHEKVVALTIDFLRGVRKALDA
jgi:tryptophan synthase alpha chain